MIISIMKRPQKKVDNKKLAEICKPRDIIIQKVYFDTKIMEDGSEVKTKKTKLVNVTKMVNESKKAIKVETTTTMISNYQTELLNKGVL